MIIEPTTDQVERVADVARQVAEWRAKQHDLMNAPCGWITIRQCEDRQARYLHETIFRFNGKSIARTDAKFLKCQGCPRFKRIANGTQMLKKPGTRVTKIRIANYDDSDD